MEPTDMLANMPVNFHEMWRWSPGKFLLIWLIVNGMTHMSDTKLVTGVNHGWTGDTSEFVLGGRHI